MESVLDRLSHYNILNYLIPGAVFVYLAEKQTSLEFSHSSIVLEVSAYYFIGLIVSRFGSLVIEPILKKLGVLQFADYGSYLAASKVDDKIDTLSEQNNMFRSLLSMAILLLMLLAFEWVKVKYPLVDEFTVPIGGAILVVLFGSAYRKQTGYVVSRVKAATRKTS